MSASALPYWRRSVAARFGCIALMMLPALMAHGWVLDARLPMRVGVLTGVALLVALTMLMTGAHAWKERYAVLLDAFIHAALLAALWPPAIALWPAAIALALALIAQRLLGGWSVNPFPPALLALAIAMPLARSLSGEDFPPPLVSLLDAGFVLAAWPAAGLALILLRLWPARAPLAFALPATLACISGGIPAMSFVTTAIVAAFALADTRHLPATRSGQALVGAFAGLGTAALWLDGAPPVAIAYPVLLACALTPWIERLTLPRATPSP